MFKIGDKVRITKEYGSGRMAGETGVYVDYVVDAYPEWPYEVRLDKDGGYSFCRRRD